MQPYNKPNLNTCQAACNGAALSDYKKYILTVIQKREKNL